MKPGSTLVVFLKYPEPGKVKTRLAADLGAVSAANLYRDWIGVVLRNVQPVRPAVHLVGYFDGAPAERFSEWSILVDEWLPQPAGDLGSRLTVAFEWGHARGGPVLAIGTDCLELRAKQILDSLSRLTDHDVVFGPATDGGYYLVGSSRHIPGLFDGIRWSSAETLADQIQHCETQGLRVALLDSLEDIDTAADWQRYQQRLGNRP